MHNNRANHLAMKSFIFAIAIPIVLVSCATFSTKSLIERVNPPILKVIAINKPVPIHTKITSAAEGIPEFIDNIFPAPNSEISMEDFLRNPLHPNDSERGISVSFSTWQIENVDFSDSNLRDAGSIALVIDDVAISNSYLSISSGELREGTVTEDNVTVDILIGVERSFVWVPPLENGWHEAKIIVNTRDGIAYEHIWSFRISDE